MASLVVVPCRRQIFTGDVRCENNDRLVTMHTSDHRRSVWYKNQRLHWFHQSARLFTEEDEEYDDENSGFAYERFLVWRDEGTYGPIRLSYG